MSINTVLIAFIILAAIATAFVLVKGVINMAQGKDLSGERSNKFMTLRVVFQLLAIVFVILLLIVGGRGAGS
ncbi:twin transmembrane helix small protein [Sandaracinobacteroides saxicola]|uniref:Twin transmembrane helix small protein n=1 Tax=Sandaracinobacteroides saxicola TaxID=2759707 RepID=A0A7G5IH22_9SPHN|nr:twin transmembrane helix small protein [Sandaracinobacteroides saxicola]QMW22664.1 twin transmembrane helix small protein [Sandaracinobacteroides saxicola]